MAITIPMGIRSVSIPTTESKFQSTILRSRKVFYGTRPSPPVGPEEASHASQVDNVGGGDLDLGTRLVGERGETDRGRIHDDFLHDERPVPRQRGSEPAVAIGPDGTVVYTAL